MKYNNPMELDLSDKKRFQFKVETKEIFPSILRLAVDTFTGKVGGGTASQLLKTADLQANAEHQAYTLLEQSFIQAIATQLKQLRKTITISNHNYHYKDWDLRFNTFRDLETIKLNLHFIDHPQGIPFLTIFKASYQKWLTEAFELSETETQTYTANFTDCFVYAFYQELADHKENYGKLLDRSNDPIRKKWALEVKRINYQQDLKAYFEKKVLGEDKIILKNVYIEPSFKVYREILPYREQTRLQSKYHIEYKVQFYPIDYNQDIHHYFYHHFLEKKCSTVINSIVEEQRLMILLGQPGHGKSSFCYKNMYDLLELPSFEGSVFFCRLQKAEEGIFDPKADTLREVLKILPEKIDAENWIADNKRAGLPTVLFLDGLDEMCMTHNLSDKQVNQFITNCKRLIKKHENLFIVITSRFNYLEIGDCYNRDCLILELGMLSVDNQIKLFQQHQTFYPDRKYTLDKKQIQKINTDEDLKHLKELITLPILLQMILLADVDITANQSKATIYSRLFDRIIDRKWANDKRFEKYAWDLEQTDLRKYLSWLAFRIYQNREGYITKQEIVHEPVTKAFVKKAVVNVKNVKKDKQIKKALKDVLILFYLTETQIEQEREENNYAIEFLHKSLYEYLMCEYVWNQIKYLFTKKYTGQDFEVRLLADVQDLFGLIQLTDETIEYLKEIVEKEKGVHPTLMQNMSNYLPDLLHYGFLHHYQIPNTTKKFYTAEQQALNCFFGYVLIWGELNKHQLNPEPYFNADWHDFHKNFIINADLSVLIKKYEAHFDITVPLHLEEMLRQNVLLPDNRQHHQLKAWLRSHLFKAARHPLFEAKRKAVNQQKENFVRWLRLISSERKNAPLFLAFLGLEKADLKGFMGERVNLIGADLRYAYLRSADLRSADLSYADLSDANLHDADLRYAYLRFADLRDADLRYADLRDADLRYAKVNQPNWIETLAPQLRAGGDWLVANFEVEQELKTFIDSDDDEYKAYQIVRKKKT